MADTATEAAATGGPAYDNNGQYTRNGILRYEHVFGRGYVSTGGHTTTQALESKLAQALRPGLRVLDVGSGIGGVAFYLAEKYDAKVVGVDLAGEMIAIAEERAVEAKAADSVRFILGDVLDESAVSGPFDLVWSRDALMHIPNKPQLFGRLLDLLGPGGALAITDYARGEGELSPEFQEYIAKTGYHVVSPRQYGNLLEDAGFVDVKVEDATDRFVAILKDEMGRLESDSAKFLAVFGEADYRYLLDRWAMKVGFCEAGDMKWGVYTARKPS